MDNFLFISTFLLTTLTYGQAPNSYEPFGGPLPYEEVLTLSHYDVEASFECTYSCFWPVSKTDPLKDEIGGIIFVDVDAFGFDQRNKVHTLQGGSWLDLTSAGIWPLSDYSIHCVTWDNETWGVKLVSQSDMHTKAISYSKKRENVKHVFSHNLQFDTVDFTQMESMKNATISNCIFDYFDKINSLDEPYGRRVNLEYSANPLYPRTDYSSLRSNRTDRSPEFLMLGRRKNRTRPYLVQMYHLSDDMIAAGEAFLTTINGRRRMNTGLVVGVMNTSEIENLDTYGLRERAVVHRKKQIYTRPKFRNFHPSALISIKLDWIVQSSREPELNMLLDGTINF